MNLDGILKKFMTEVWIQLGEQDTGSGTTPQQWGMDKS